MNGTTNGIPDSPSPSLLGILRGRPVQIVALADDSPTVASTAADENAEQVVERFVLLEDALRNVVSRPELRGLRTMVLSVAGAFRKGKSFLLDFMLRFLQYAEQKQRENPKWAPDMGDDSWFGDLSAPLEGFRWRGGMDRETTGIWLWSEPVLLRDARGERVAVLLMDTQGAFDSSSTVRQCATIFALSTMLSSVQLFNLSSNIQEDDLQHLQLFTEYGRLALEDQDAVATATADLVSGPISLPSITALSRPASGPLSLQEAAASAASQRPPPFQSLFFLVRDWSYPYQAAFGLTGGEKVLEKVLTPSAKQHVELAQLRTHIRRCFSSIRCFLMPHPGLEVATNQQFDGRLDVVDRSFRGALMELMPILFRPENLVAKQIDNADVEIGELVDYLKSYMRIYSSNELPEPKTMYLATAEANNLAAVHASLEYYRAEMEGVCGGARPYEDPAVIESRHAELRAEAGRRFAARKKMGGAEFSRRYQQQLDSEIDTYYTECVRQNEQKNVFRTARTPGTLFLTIVLAYVLYCVLDLIGLSRPAYFSWIIMFATFVVLVFWGYVRFTGNYSEVGTSIDNLSYALHTNVYQPCVQQVVTRALTDNVRASIRNTLINGAASAAHASQTRTFGAPIASGGDSRAAGAGFELRARTVRSDASRS